MLLPLRWPGKLDVNTVVRLMVMAMITHNIETVLQRLVLVMMMMSSSFYITNKHT